MSDIKRWTTLSLLPNEIVETIRSCIVFGSSGGEVLLLTKDDRVLAMGTNQCSCLGSPTAASLEPRPIDYLTGRGIVNLAVGAGPHVIGLTEEGGVYAWGHNAFGQLGLGHKVQGTSPMMVQGIISQERIVGVACGGHHTVVLSDRGEIFSWGLNGSGQLGIGSCIDQDMPQKVPLPNRLIVCVSCGHNNTMALSRSGDVYAWGFNGNGQTGTDNSSNQTSPRIIEVLSRLGPVIQIACGYAHCLALTDQGDLFVWGSNSCGQLGGTLCRHNQVEPKRTAEQLGRISDIAAIHMCNASVVSNREGTVYMWGHLRGQSRSSPLATPFKIVDDAFACFACPPVSSRMISFECNRRETVADVMRAAFDDAATADLRILAGGRVLHAHRALLKMRSQYFKTRLGEMWSENNGSEIEVKDFSYSVFRAFLAFLYTDEVIVSATEDAIGLLELATCYCEDGLKDRCETRLRDSVSSDNAARLYQVALRFDVAALEEHCFRFCVNHLTAVTQSESFLSMDESSLKSLIHRASKEGAFNK